MELLKSFNFSLLLLATVFVRDASASPDFAREIEPVFAARCLKCHGPEKQNGGIRYDQKESALGRGDSGAAAIVPGNAEESELLMRITTENDDDRMPPKGERLGAAEIELLRSWIASGAMWPEAPLAPEQTGERSRHWSFQPVQNPPVPKVRDAVWSGNPIDAFLQEKRETLHLDTTTDADPAVLLRRLCYTLTGLPPSPDDVIRFLEDSKDRSSFSTACERMIDELLESHSYGERWARHWLDWVRYSDTAGDNSDFPIPQAYLYRNFVIDAFNADLPYDRFLTEQIAGDLLPSGNQEEKNRLTIATGYIAMARRFGSLVERYPQHLTIEDTIDNLGRTVLGLTISCARCHDHKFDPITTRDYYGLYGFFASTRYPFPGIELFQTQWNFVPLIPASEAAEKTKPSQKQTDELTNELTKILASCEERAVENAIKEADASVEEQRRMTNELDKMLIKARSAGEKLASHLKSVPVIPTAYAVQDSKPINARIQIKGEPTRPGAEVFRKFPDVLGGQILSESVSQKGSGRLDLARWITDSKNPLTARVIVNRIWQRHFGTGLVPSTSDFGLRGEVPTHPELLDWLASDFMANGWSIKHLHRLILTSRTYQLSSIAVSENLAKDPNNTAYWRFQRQRLDAESLRDTLLFLSGRLDSSPQSAPYPIPPIKDWKYTQHHPFKEDYPDNKRSIYQMTRRLTASPYLQTFDGPDPNVCTASRDSSVTALQALYFVNDPFLHEQAGEFAKSLLRQEGSDEEHLDRAFLAMLARQPDQQESEVLLAHLVMARKKVGNEEAAWASVTRSLLRLNEFLYLD